MEITALAQTSEFFDERAARYQRRKECIHRLSERAHNLIQSNAPPDPANIANYRRVENHEAYCRPLQTGRPGHWSSFYLTAAEDPTYRTVHRALLAIALQTARPDGTHDLQGAALFHAAAAILVPEACRNADHDSDGIVPFADAIIRAGVSIPEPERNPLLAAATHQAVHDALLEADADNPLNPKQEFTDDRGRHIVVTKPLGDIRRAERIAAAAQQHEAVPSDDPHLNKLSKLTGQLPENAEQQSARECAATAIHEYQTYHLAEPVRLGVEEAQAIHAAAALIHRRHEGRVAENPSRIQRDTPDLPTGKILKCAEQQELLCRLENAGRPYDDRMYSITRSHERWERLDNEYAHQMVHYCRIIMAAAHIASVHLQDRRDGVMLAATGRINRHARDQFDLHMNLAPAGDRSWDTAMERLETAVDIMGSVPERAVAERAKAIILQHDDQRMDAITLLRS